MATSIVMPQMGYDMKEGKVVRWRKKEGEQVNRGEVIAEIETDKAVVEMEAFAGGVLSKIVAQEGATVPVGETIALIGQPGEKVEGATPAQPTATGAPQASAPPKAGTDQAQAPTAAVGGPVAAAQASGAPAAPAGEIKATPIARRIARERGIDLATVKGTGPGGRITESDIEAAASRPAAAPAAPRPQAPAPAPAPAAQAPAAPAAPARPPAQGERVPLTRMKQTIARRTAQSKREAPHFYVTTEVDMTKAVDFRKQLNAALEKDGVRVTINDMIVKAAAKALVNHPNLNSFYDNDALVRNTSVNIGIVISVEQGLIVPSVTDCQSKSLVEIAKATKVTIERAQKGMMKPEEFSAATFSVSNLGMFDVENFIAVILPPQAAMLATGTVKPHPVVRDNQVVARQTMTATVSVDHRVTDGVEAAVYLQEFKRYLEEPLLLLA